MTPPAAHWRPMQPQDLPQVNAIADVVHEAYPEDPAVVTERLALFPLGCRVAESASGPIGYAVAHPWRLVPPPLDSMLVALPEQIECLYLHDVALLPATRGARLGEALVSYLQDLARQIAAPRLALTAVYETPHYWSRFGFTPYRTPAIAEKLASYSETATFMVRAVD
ncbi:MAG: GNAT family N-acetyltransferase [Elstera sp.]